jgi:DNA polymerase-4
VPRFVLHVDLDQFIAAVEVLRHPELAGMPVVVGGDGDPTKRGVVSTASYEAREFGIHSAMPLRTAYKRCPEAVFLPVDAEAYLAASRRVMETLRSFPAVVEVAGWDEAFMEVQTEDPEELARDVQRAVLDRTQLWSSIGVGDNKLRAKLAAGFAKPAGVFRLTRKEWPELMAGLPTEALWGIGRKTASKLTDLGIRTVHELETADEALLGRAFGPRTGPWLRRLATGEDESPVSAAAHIPRSQSIERTYQENIADPEEMRSEIAKLARELLDDLAEREPRPVERVVVKVRFEPFITKSRSSSLEAPTQDPGAIERAALAALGRFDLERPVRLLGVKAEFVRATEDARPLSA